MRVAVMPPPRPMMQHPAMAQPIAHHPSSPTGRHAVATITSAAATTTTAAAAAAATAATTTALVAAADASLDLLHAKEQEVAQMRESALRALEHKVRTG